MMRAGFLISILVCTATRGQVVTYEGNVFPEEEGWERILADTPGAERSIVDGWLVLEADIPEGWTRIDGDADLYRRPLAGFLGVDQFFVEWRAVTDNPSELLDFSAVPAALVLGGNSSYYHTTFTVGAVQLLRRTFIPLVIVHINEGVPHVYRLEIHGLSTFAWYIDGQVVEAGTPLASYPDPTAILIWGVRRSYIDATTMWDYIRYGVIPEDGSGDFDSDGFASLDDFYFNHECLTNDRPGIKGGPDNDAGPGCRFADFDSNGDTDLFDFAVIQNLFTGNPP